MPRWLILVAIQTDNSAVNIASQTSGLASGVGSHPIVLSGVLDQYQAEHLKQQLLEATRLLPANANAVSLEMSGVEQIDTSCLQVLLAFQAGLAGKRLKIHAANSTVRKWIGIAGAEPFFELVEVEN